MDIENNVVVIIPTYNESKNISILLDLLVNLSIDILIVDDNITNCKVLERKLGLKGLKCRIAYDGKNAIKEVEKRLPDLKSTIQ